MSSKSGAAAVSVSGLPKNSGKYIRCDSQQNFHSLERNHVLNRGMTDLANLHLLSPQEGGEHPGDSLPKLPSISGKVTASTVCLSQASTGMATQQQRIGVKGLSDIMHHSQTPQAMIGIHLEQNAMTNANNNVVSTSRIAKFKIAQNRANAASGLIQGIGLPQMIGTSPLSTNASQMAKGAISQLKNGNISPLLQDIRHRRVQFSVDTTTTAAAATASFNVNNTQEEVTQLNSCVTDSKGLTAVSSAHFKGNFNQRNSMMRNAVGLAVEAGSPQKRYPQFQHKTYENYDRFKLTQNLNVASLDKDQSSAKSKGSLESPSRLASLPKQPDQLKVMMSSSTETLQYSDVIKNWNTGQLTSTHYQVQTKMIDCKEQQQRQIKIHIEDGGATQNEMKSLDSSGTSPQKEQPHFNSPPNLTKASSLYKHDGQSRSPPSQLKKQLYQSLESKSPPIKQPKALEQNQSIENNVGQSDQQIPQNTGFCLHGSSVLNVNGIHNQSSELQNPFKRKTSQIPDYQKDKQMRNMTRKHMIHQRIKCQGIPVIQNMNSVNPLSEQMYHFKTQMESHSSFSNTHSSQQIVDSRILQMHAQQHQQIMSYPPRQSKLMEMPSQLSLTSLQQTGSQKQSIFEGINQRGGGGLLLPQKIKNYSSLAKGESGPVTKFKEKPIQSGEIAGFDVLGTPFTHYLNRNTKGLKGSQDKDRNRNPLGTRYIKNVDEEGDPIVHFETADKNDRRRTKSSSDHGEGSLLEEEEQVESAKPYDSSAMQYLMERTMKNRFADKKHSIENEDNLNGQHLVVDTERRYRLMDDGGSQNGGGVRLSISNKNIQSIKQYASKDRFLKILDQIASTALKDQAEFEGNGGKLCNEGAREMAYHMVQDQIRQKQSGIGRSEQRFELLGTQALNLYRQAITPITGERRSLGQINGNIESGKTLLSGHSSQYNGGMPMKISQLQAVDNNTGNLESLLKGQKRKQILNQTAKSQLQTAQTKKSVAPRAPLVPAKPKTRLDLIMNQNLASVTMSDIIELFTQVNKLLNMTIKFKDSYSNLHIQEIKLQTQSLGIKLSAIELQLSYIKSNAFVSVLRQKLSTMFNRFLNPWYQYQHSQKLQGVMPGNSLGMGGGPGPGMVNGAKPIFKFWVECSGNNHNLVKQTFKKRPWMIQCQDYVPPSYGTQGPSHSQNPDDEDLQKATPHLIFTQLRRTKVIRELTHDQIYNHIDGINAIATKSGLFLILKEYFKDKEGTKLFDVVPETYLINVECKSKEDCDKKDQQLESFYRVAGDHIWILKPGENTNRGHGIQIFNDSKKIIRSINSEYLHTYKTVILQKYIPNPYLISKRKFDFRVYSLMTYVYQPATAEQLQPMRMLRGYFYEEGYLRTSCKEFSLKRIDNKFVHLTNDAVQKSSSDYGKFENGNKVSYEDFKTQLLKEKGVEFSETILLQIKEMIRQVFDASGPQLIGEIRSDYNAFELMGFDFMLDSDLKLYLIEINTNPCLETQQSILLQRIIPQVLDQTIKIAVDPFLRATEHQYSNAPEITLSELKYELIYEHKFENDPLKVPAGVSLPVTKPPGAPSMSSTTAKNGKIQKEIDEIVVGYNQSERKKVSREESKDGKRSRQDNS